MIFSRTSLVLVTILFSLSLYSQNSRFSSQNIDSLLTAYNAHKEIGLPKAYCLDQIVRYYSNNNDYTSASTYSEAYKNASSILKNEDVSARFEYRNARLKYLISGKKDMDTLAYRKSYDYFKKNDPDLCAGISYALSLYLDGKALGHGGFTKADNATRVKWYVLSGEDNFDRERYDRSAAAYCNASIIAPQEEAELLCKKALRSNEMSTSKKWTTNIYRSLMEIYKSFGDQSKLDELEQELLKNDKTQLLNYYEWQMYEKDVQMYYGGGFNISGKWYKKYDALLAEVNPEKHKKWKTGEAERNRKWEENLLKEQKKKKSEEDKNRLINEIQESTASIKLPQGSFYLDSYDEGNNKTKVSLNITGSNITKQEIYLEQDTTMVDYIIHRIYPIKENILLLSVQEKEEDYSNWDFKIMRITKDAISLHDDFYGKNSEKGQDEHMVKMIEELKTEDYKIHLEPRFEEYYNKNKFSSLNKLKLLKLKEHKKIRKLFKKKNEPQDDIDELWYKKFIKYNGSFPHEYVSQKRALKNLLIEKGYQPFSSISSFLGHEKETLPYWDRSHLVSKKLKEFKFVKNDGVLGIWIIEQPTETCIVRIEHEALTMWYISNELDKTYSHFGDKEKVDYMIKPSLKELTNIKEFDSLNLRLDIGNRMDKYKVDGVLPEKVKTYIDNISPVMKINGKVIDKGYILLEIDGNKRYMISRNKYEQICKMKKVYKNEDYKALRDTLRKEVVVPEFNTERLMKQAFFPGYDELSFKLIEELIRLGYNLFKSKTSYRNRFSKYKIEQ